jgi:hypothetical protein
MLLKLAAGTWQLRRICTRAQPMDDQAGSLPASPFLRLLLSDAVAGPVCFGLFRSTILLPRHTHQDSSPLELRMILRHELAHIQRRDAWTNLLQRLLEAVLFFHPGMWFASRQLTQQRELICDNWVLADGASPGDYARILSQVAEAALAPRLQAAALFEGRLLERVRSLVDPSRIGLTHISRRAGWLSLCAAAACFAAVGMVRLEAGPTTHPDGAAKMAAVGGLLIKVVDEQGRPVEGAKITPWGIRALPNAASAYGWSTDFSYGVPPQPVFTDAAGQARLPYPMRIRTPYEGTETDMDTCAIILAVYHPLYSPTVDQNYQTDRPHDPLVMHPGAVLKLSGYVSSPDNAVVGIRPQISNWSVSLKETMREDKGVCTVNGVPAGPHYIRLVYWPDKGSPRFTDPVLVNAEVGQTYTRNLELKTPMRLEGQVDGSVPRPVRNGYVQVRVSYPAEPQSDAGYDYWDDWARIDEDGTFHIDALPRGTVQVIGVCDGFTWKISGVDTQPGWAASALSQEFTPENDTVHVELKMQPAAAFEVHTVDPDGQPIEGVKMVFHPVARWFSSRMQVVDPLMRSSDLPTAAVRGEKVPWTWIGYYEAVTDSRGAALVHNLPAFGKPIGPSVEHAKYERSWSASLTEKDLVLVPGEMKKITINMVPRSGRGAATQSTQPPASQSVRPGTLDSNVTNAQTIIADLKETFQAGRAEVGGEEASRPDSRMGILAVLVRDKIPYVISQRVRDAAPREAALAQVDRIRDYMNNTVVPAWDKARQSKQADDARALVPLMDGLRDQLTGLQRIANSGSAGQGNAPGSR